MKQRTRFNQYTLMESFIFTVATSIICGIVASLIALTIMSWPKMLPVITGLVVFGGIWILVHVILNRNSE